MSTVSQKVKAAKVPSERAIELYLCSKVKELKGLPYKFTSPGNSGVPDRLVLLPNGRTFFIELKAPGRHPSALQMQQIAKIRGLGFTVFVIDSKEQVDDFINVVKRGGQL